ncbi:hypothetical protein NLJ89_g4309 [Agrocybe chaxingu]|uniref:C2H2-type domain-containing protein n=1 Tax=Agrocybe chaxingu TaxID=84603 RepID=A0A9W8K3C4_9AGAR|nr:hypothetical protein NLJ89_g4309 [Agrocybe chaxingu]
MDSPSTATRSSSSTDSGDHQDEPGIELHHPPSEPPLPPPEGFQWPMFLPPSGSQHSNFGAGFGGSPSLQFPAGDPEQQFSFSQLFSPSTGSFPGVGPTSAPTASLTPAPGPDVFDTLHFMDPERHLKAACPSPQRTVSTDDTADDASYSTQNYALPIVAFDPSQFTLTSLSLPNRIPPPLGVNSRTVSSNSSHQSSNSNTSGRSGRGLSGWCDSEVKDLPCLESLSSNLQRKRQRSISPPFLGAASRSDGVLSAVSSRNSSASGHPASSLRETKRLRPALRSTSTRSSTGGSKPGGHSDPEGHSDEESSSDSDSDDYRPSRSPSPAVPTPSFGRVPWRKPKARKGKAKGSAALALAVVSQMGAAKHREGSEHLYDSEDFDSLTLYREGVTGIRKRKNHPIPLPIPIPNLNKKSRGRKVPFVAGLEEGDEVESKQTADATQVSETQTSGRTRKKAAPAPAALVDELAGSRTIHTHDKPHPCPYEGCDKSFSRRDNLGQHVRIHLQP